MISWLALSASLAAFTSFAVWSRLPTKARGITVAALLVIVPTSGGLLLSERGWATPLVPYLADLPSGELDVQGFHLVPEESIYLMLAIDGEPRLFVLPWNSKAASQLQRAQEQGRGVKGKPNSKRRTDEDFPMEFHGTPQRAHPEKMPEQSYQYERSDD